MKRAFYITVFLGWGIPSLCFAQKEGERRRIAPREQAPASKETEKPAVQVSGERQRAVPASPQKEVQAVPKDSAAVRRRVAE